MPGMDRRGIKREFVREEGGERRREEGREGEREGKRRGEGETMREEIWRSMYGSGREE